MKEKLNATILLEKFEHGEIMDFDQVIGQKEIIACLKNAIRSEKIGHAYIFEGPEGIGKKMMAEIYAGILLCNNQSGMSACGKCISCSMLENGSNPEYFVLDNNEETSIGVDEIRSLQSEINNRPLYAKRKIIVITKAEKMTVQAQNCLLKTFEEPPSHVTIILTTSKYESLLETIRSRAVKYSFKRNTFKEVYEVIASQCSGEENCSFITAYSEGVIGKALQYSKSKDFFEIRDRAISIALQQKEQRLYDALIAYPFFETNKDQVGMILDVMLLFFRDMLVIKESENENMLINLDKKDIILDNAKSYSLQSLLTSIEAIETTRKNLRHNANYQLSIEMMLMKLQEDSI